MNLRDIRLSILLWAIAFLALFAGFRWNVWHAASKDVFLHWQKDTEALVIGRLVASRDSGFFSGGGLLGFVGDSPELVTYDTSALWESYNPAAQLRYYLEGTPFSSFGPYFSHSGFQGSFFALLDRVLGFLAPASRLSIFFGLTAGLVAAVYATVIALIRRELGPLAALLALGALVASPWLTTFARNIYFSLWLFWLPAIAIGAVLSGLWGRAREARRLAVAAFLAFLLRFLAGYEFVTETVALAAVPIFYYSFRDGLGLGALAKRMGIAAGATLLALVTSLGVLTFQITKVTGTPRESAKHINFAIARRTHGDPNKLPPVYAAALRAKTGDIVRSYLVDSFSRDTRAKPPVLRWVLSRSHGELIVWILAAAAWIGLRARWLPSDRRRRSLGVVIGMVLTLTGVLAWLVVFKAHSALHMHVNPLMWHLGFFLLGAALIGFVLEDAVRLAVRAGRSVAARSLA